MKKSLLLHKQIEHVTSFNLVPGSSILDNYIQNNIILEKQLSTPIVWENRLKRLNKFRHILTISTNFLKINFSQKLCCRHNPGFTCTGHISQEPIMVQIWTRYQNEVCGARNKKVRGAYNSHTLIPTPFDVISHIQCTVCINKFFYRAFKKRVSCNKWAKHWPLLLGHFLSLKCRIE
jgi:hypothetical protein